MKTHMQVVGRDYGVFHVINGGKKVMEGLHNLSERLHRQLKISGR